MQRYSIVLCNSGVKHSLGDSAYNERVAECKIALTIIQHELGKQKTFNNTDIEELKTIENKFDAIVYKRCKYVIEEIKRVEKAIEFLKTKDLENFGKLMYETHYGLQYEYEVSCEELDFLVDFTINKNEVLGARMMGGGFGGCTINLIENEYIEQFITKIQKAYQDKFNLQLDCYQVKIDDGVELILKK
jgi:galactokinase